MNDKILVGTWAEIPTPYVTDILSSAGLDFSIIESEARFDSMESAVILNDYETFIDKVNHTIKAL